MACMRMLTPGRCTANSSARTWGLPCRSCAYRWHATAAAGWKRLRALRGMRPLQRPWPRVSGWHWRITVTTRPKPSCCARCALPALTDWRRCVRSARSARARCGARCSATHAPTWRPMRRRMQCAGSTTPAIPIRSTSAISCARRFCRRCSSAGRWRPMHWPAARSCAAMPAPCCTTTTSTCCPPSATAPAPWSCSHCAAIPRAPRTPVARLGGRCARAAAAGAGRARTRTRDRHHAAGSADLLCLATDRNSPLASAAVPAQCARDVASAVAGRVERRQHTVIARRRATATARHAGLALRAATASARAPGGERIVLPGRTHSHQLKHLLQQSDLPPWERTRLPLLWAGKTLLAAGDQIVSAKLDQWLRAHAARLQWRSAAPAN